MHSVGRVHSWVWDDGAPHPSVVYLKFEGATWKLDGIDEAGENFGRRAAGPLRGQEGGPNLRRCGRQPVASRHDCLILRPFEHWLFERGVSEGPQLLLQQLRGEKVDWLAYKEGLAPWATCRRCFQVKTLDGYEHEQWEHVRANRPAMCMQCKHGDDGSGQDFGRLRARAMGARSCEPAGHVHADAKRIACSTCKINKIEDAFPRAQLKQEGQEKCLTCCQAIKRLQCCGCRKAKGIEHFSPTMVTLPLAAAACKECQESVKAQAVKNLRKNWFKCRTCQDMFPSAACSDPSSENRRCLNCASRGTRQKDEQTCRGCKRRFHEKQEKGRKRSRRCPDCRRK
eukprot:s1242_g16.t1